MKSENYIKGIDLIKSQTQRNWITKNEKKKRIEEQI